MYSTKHLLFVAAMLPASSAMAVDIEESTEACFRYSSLNCAPIDAEEYKDQTLGDLWDEGMQYATRNDFQRWVEINRWPEDTKRSDRFELREAGMFIVNGFHPDEIDKKDTGWAFITPGAWKFSHPACYDQIVEGVENDAYCVEFVGGASGLQSSVQSFLKIHVNPTFVSSVDSFAEANDLDLGNPIVNHQTFYLMPGFSLREVRQKWMDMMFSFTRAQDQ